MLAFAFLVVLMSVPIFAQTNGLSFEVKNEPVTVLEGGEGSLEVRLSAEPSSDVVVSVNVGSGDTDIMVKLGSEQLTFTTSDWKKYQTITLQAAEDDDVINGEAIIQLSASGVNEKDVTAVEEDNDELNFVTDKETVTVLEGGEGTFEVSLSAEPSTDVVVSVSKKSGDEDITVKSGSELTFISDEWNIPQTVTLEAAEDEDALNGKAKIRISASGIPDKDITATEQDNESLTFITDVDELTVPEGGTATFQVKLSTNPITNVTVTVTHFSGDSDISIKSGSSPTFSAGNWNEYQTVTLEAAEDADTKNGHAKIRISDSALVIPHKDVTAYEEDNDIANISLKLNPHTGTTGNIIKISIDISNNTIPITFFGLNFSYESTLFTINSIKKGSLTSDWSIIGGDEETPGTITISGAAGGGKAIKEDSQGTLIRIWLRVKCVDFPPETESEISEIMIQEYSDGLEGFSPEDCTAYITLVPCSRVGDVNSDGVITPGDAQNTLEIYLGKRVPEFCQKTTSDSNGDESTTPGDAQNIFDCYLGRRELPECHDDGSTGMSSTASFATLKRVRDKKRLKLYKPKVYPLNTIGYSGKIVNIPIIITNPEGISSFSFEVNYLPELLEYTGIRRSQLTNEFDYLRGIEEIKGLVRVEGESKQPIKYNKYASLAVLAFRVKEGVNGSLPIIVFNPGKDLFNVEIDDGTFFGLEYFDDHERFLSLGKASIMPDRTLRIPVKVSSAFNIKSFGLEIKYPTEKMLFAGINRGELTKNFTSVEGNESEPGVVRVGGYSMSGIQERKPGMMVEIVFWIKEMDGKVEIVKLVDDIQDFIIQNRRTRWDKKRNREKKLWFLKSYDHR